MVVSGMKKISGLTHFASYLFFPLKANAGSRCLRHTTCTDLTVKIQAYKWRFKPQAQN